MESATLIEPDAGDTSVNSGTAVPLQRSVAVPGVDVMPELPPPHAESAAIQIAEMSSCFMSRYPSSIYVRARVDGKRDTIS